MDNVVTIRNFSRNVYEYLKPGDYVVTKNGKPYLSVTVEELPVTETEKIVGREKIRKLVEEKDNLCGKCFYCRDNLNGIFHIDHIIPKSKGGEDKIENYHIACPRCNRAKYNDDLETFFQWVERIKSDGVVTTEDVVTKKIKTKSDAINAVGSLNCAYRCGCVRQDGKTLCPKHGRY